MLLVPCPTGHHVGLGAEETFVVEVNQLVRCFGDPDFGFPGIERENAPSRARFVNELGIFKEQLLWRRKAADWLAGCERMDVIVVVTCD